MVKIPFGMDSGRWMAVSFLLAFGALVGDAAGSFIKRRLNMKRGAPAPLLDQLNFVVGGLVFASFILPMGVPPMTPEYWIALFVITPIGHLAVNYTGYQLKMKDVPW
ncbi:MAG: CDP-archaeol synthase, partial [Euryarchaeota archaeon]|nr:CDP-archaeol synthase [Euryarchaeota archaeon]